MTDSQDSPPRRRFLQTLAIAPASTLAAGVALKTSQAETLTNAPPAGTAYAPTYFDKAEWAFIQAAVDHLIPADDLGPGALAAGVPEFIDRQMETPYGHGKLWYMQGPFHPDVDPTYGWQIDLVPREVYRHGIADCNAYCQQQYGKAFVDLDKAAQEQVLKDVEAGKPRFAKVPPKTFFGQLLGNTKEGFLSDPQYGGNKHMVGWKMLGFTGARGDFLGWPEKGNVKYPYGPVSISGEKA